MVTAEDIARIAVFERLTAAQCDEVARVAADVALEPGEYAAQQGDEGALFAVLDGRIEAVRLADGVENIVGSREVGDLFGEVPITLGTFFPVGFRAAQASRVMRIEPHDYYAVASSDPEIAKQVGQLAANRMSGTRGLQGLASAPAPPRALVVGHRWDAACTDLRRFLERNQVSFRWLTPHAPGADEAWGGPLPPDDDLPAIQIIGGKTVVHPSYRRVAELLELGTEPHAAEYDVLVVGAGPSGLAAAVYGASEGLRTVVVEQEAPGGQAGTSSRIENYLGFPAGVSGDELASRALRQARRLGAEILVTRTIERIDTTTKRVYFDGGDVLRAKTIILACGVAWRQLDIEGFDHLSGKGIYYGAARSEAANAHGLDIHIVGAGNSAGQSALFFANHAHKVTILCRGSSLAKSMSRYLIDHIELRGNIEVLLDTQVTGAYGDLTLAEIEVENRTSGERTRLPSDGMYIFIGADAKTEWLPPEIALDGKGFVLTGDDVKRAGHWQLERDPYLLETSVPGIFACGDVRSAPVKRVAAAVGEGSMAIAFVHQLLREPSD